MTSSITMAEREGTGAQETLAAHTLHSTCTNSVVIMVTTPQSQWDPELLSVPSTRSHEVRACCPPQHHRAWVRLGGVNSRCSCLLP